MKKYYRLFFAIFIFALSNHFIFAKTSDDILASPIDINQEKYDNEVLDAGDSVSVWVVGEPELSTDAVIKDDGTVLMPLVGYVKISGKTKNEAIKVIEAAYRDGYLQKPIVHMGVRIHTRVTDASIYEDEEDSGELVLYDEEKHQFDNENTIEENASDTHNFIHLYVLDAVTKRGIKHAYIKFMNNKVRYTDKRGYVRLPIRYNDSEALATVKILHNSYEKLETKLSFSGEKKQFVRLYKSKYEKPEPKTETSEVLKKTESVIRYSPQEILDAKVTLEFVNSNLKTILNELATRFDLTLFIEEDKRKYNLRAEDVTVRELLKNLLLAHGCQYSFNGKNLSIVLPIGKEKKTAKEILFRDMNLFEALHILAGMMKINLFISPDVKDRVVNFYVDNMNLNELLDVVLETNNLKKIYKGNNSYIIQSR